MIDVAFPVFICYTGDESLTNSNSIQPRFLFWLSLSRVRQADSGYFIGMIKWDVFTVLQT